jgi:hypothetical protein
VKILSPSSRTFEDCLKYDVSEVNNDDLLVLRHAFMEDRKFILVLVQVASSAF